MKKLNKHRNHAAHMAYVLTIEEQENSEKMKEFANIIAKVTKTVKACMKELAREHSRVTKEPISEEIIDSI